MSATVLTPEILDSAASIMRERGLCQWAYTDESGAVCILAAVAVARGQQVFGADDLDCVVEEPIGELAVLMGRDPVMFSDDHGRTTDEVADALADAAQRLRAEATS